LKIKVTIQGQIGHCGSLEGFIGFASAKDLYEHSFADVLNEDTGEGYQRPRNIQHSKSFKQYILTPRASTIPLTFNLRRDLRNSWSIERLPYGRAILHLKEGTRCLAQVDCQHRLGELKDLDIPLAFMAFIGLDLRTEMAMFNIINSKAKGLSSSLTDYHESNLIEDLINDAPHLFIAKKLNDDPSSPWHKMIRYGGETTSGLKRRTSLRMMQKTIQKFLKQVEGSRDFSTEDYYQLIASYWSSIKRIFSNEWKYYRSNLLTKGIGLYSLMYLLSDLVIKAPENVEWEGYFDGYLGMIKANIDWNSHGMFADAGGQKGAIQVYHSLKRVCGL